MVLSRLRVLPRAVLTLVLALAALPVLAQAPAQAPPPVSAPAPAPGRETSAASVRSYLAAQLMPVDPEVATGTLPNGLRYYVRANAKPARRIELRLVVKAGSVLEDPDQLGLAHFLEHMEFEGTQHFPGGGINDFLASLGLGIGPDANAATSFDDTQYTLRIPAGSPQVLDRALLVLEDWAHAATFDQEAIDRQRAIVLSEWRLHLGAVERTQDRIRKVQLEGSRYADRPPIGDPAVIEKAQREQLLRFYRDWYRPDLMAVIVVGDLNRDATVAMIKAHFSSLTSPTPRRPRPAFDVPERQGTRYTVIADKESTATGVAISNLRPARPQDSVGGYRQIMMDQLFGDMLEARLDELDQRENPPFLRAGAGRRLFDTPRTKDEVVLQALVPSDGVTKGLDALVTEIQRVTRYGFTATELARAKQAMMLSYERSVTESPDRESSSRADEYTRNFLQREALPTIWQELAFHRRFLPGITLAELNALAAQWFPAQNRLVIVTGPEAAGVTLATEMQLAGTIRTASARPVTRYVDEGADQALMPMPPAKGSIVKVTQRPDAGITEWTLSNGATVVLKPTTLKEDQILFRAFAPGGTSLAADADFVSARSADYVVPAGGVGKVSDGTLDKLLNGRAVAVTPFIGESDQGMTGGSTPQDLETFFQLLHLRFTQPRADPAAFFALTGQVRALVANRSASPDAVFRQTIDEALTRNSPRRALDTQATVAQWDLPKSLAFYKARFADASRFTFVFVGSFTPDLLKPFVETYLASLPATHTSETWRDEGITPPRGVVERTIEKGIAPKSQVGIVFSGPMVYDDAQRLALRAVTLVLQGRLFDTIRQELGGTYSITADQQTQKVPRPEFRVSIEWACDPARTAALVQRVFDEIRFVRDTSFTPDQVRRIRAALLRDFDQDSQDNGYLLNQIVRRYEDGDAAHVAAVFDLPDQIATLTGEAIQQAARTYLDTANYVKVTLLPEAK
ncbi:MAG TPA: insulinase family protein [Vicinamibacterales bacterium]|jgi:zinc protease|nr:insulinase family protein [Vicinamibacterales bacterium]